MEIEIRPTNLCQLRCKHCYISEFLERKEKIIWDFSDIDKVVEFSVVLVEMLSKEDNIFEVSVRITGGEPFLLGVDKLRYMIKKLRDEVKPTALGISSNFLLYNCEIGKLIKDYDLLMFASYDPDIRFSRQELENLWIRKVKQAIKDGIDLIVSLVLTKKVIEKRWEVLNFLKNLGVKKIYFAPYSSVGRGAESFGDLCPTREEVVDFVISLLENEKDIHIIPFQDINKGYYDFKVTNCGGIECWSDCYNDFGINPDFSVTSVGMCYYPYFYGVIGDDVRKSVSEILGNVNRIKFLREKLFGESNCTKCEYYTFCRGGCLSIGKHFYVSECRGLKSLLDYAIKGSKKLT